MAKRRSNGEGTLRQRPNGLWELTLMDGFQSDGRRKYKSFYAKTQKEVKQKARAYQDAKAEGIEVDVVYYFDEWADLWFESHKDNIMPTTQENYQYTLRILKSAFPHKKIRDIKPFDIEMMLKKLRRDGRSTSCLTQCRGMMYQIMNKAEHTPCNQLLSLLTSPMPPQHLQRLGVLSIPAMLMRILYMA